MFWDLIQIQIVCTKHEQCVNLWSWQIDWSRAGLRDIK